MKILLIEDNPDIALLLSEQLSEHDWDFAINGVQGYRLATANNYDLILLDLNLPGMDGMSLCARLRQEGFSTPVIMLTARDTREDLLQGLGTGADDYLVKPFDIEELQLRMAALIRRASGQGFATRLEHEDISVDLVSQRVCRAGQEIKLTPVCFAILTCLIRRPGELISREALERAIWPDDPPDDDMLRRHMYILRQKLDKPFAIKRIHTLSKKGYQLS